MPGEDVVRLPAQGIENEPVKFYIAGPVSDSDDLNVAAFRHVAKQVHLQLQGEPFLPQEMEVNHSGPCPSGKIHPLEKHPQQCYMRAGISLMLSCDAVAMVPGWQLSRGARVELLVATASGLPVYVCDRDGVLHELI